MADITDTIMFPGEVNVLQADLISSSGKAYDITGLIMDLSLYEDIFSNTMSGYIVIEDAVDLINMLPMTGQEIFTVILGTPSLGTKIKKSFYVYKLQNRTTKKRIQLYTLSFCSLELINSVNSKVSKVFPKGSITGHVSSIFSDDKYLASASTLKTEVTVNPLEFIAPFWSPLETINWLSGKAMNGAGASNFLFYETNQSFEFYTIDKLLGGPTVREYTYSDIDANTVYGATGDVDSKSKIIQFMNTPVIFDYLRNTAAGMHASTLYTLDLTTKDINKSNTDYIDDFGKTTHTEKTPLRSANVIRKKVASMHFIHKNDYLTGKNSPIEYSKFFSQRNSLLEQMAGFRFTIKVFGRTDIKVGDVVKITLNDFRQITKEEIDSEGRNDYFNGRKLITAIRHQITNGRHKMEMELVADSFMK